MATVTSAAEPMPWIRVGQHHARWSDVDGAVGGNATGKERRRRPPGGRRRRSADPAAARLLAPTGVQTVQS